MENTLCESRDARKLQCAQHLTASPLGCAAGPSHSAAPCFYCTPAQRAMSMKFSPPTTLLANRMASVVK